MTTHLLKLNNIHVSYGGVHALKGVSVSLGAGEIVALMGGNGAGKSTILKAIFGIAPISRGHVIWHDATIIPKSHEMVKRGMGFVPQGRRVFAGMTVEENLEVGGFIISSSSERVFRMKEIYKTFPVLEQKKNQKAGALSGGQQQMLAIGRALMTNPSVLLLDEPSLGLAPNIVKDVFSILKKVNENHGTSLLIVEHNIRSLLGIAHRAYILDKGEIVAEGSGEELKTSGVIEKTLLGNPV